MPPSFIIGKYLNEFINLSIFSTKSFLNKLSDIFNSYVYKGLIELLITQLFLMQTIYFIKINSILIVKNSLFTLKFLNKTCIVINLLYICTHKHRGMEQ